MTSLNNDQAVAYMILAMNENEYNIDKINKVRFTMYSLMDYLTEGEAERKAISIISAD